MCQRISKGIKSTRVSIKGAFRCGKREIITKAQIYLNVDIDLESRS